MSKIHLSSSSIVIMVFGLLVILAGIIARPLFIFISFGVVMGLLYKILFQTNEKDREEAAFKKSEPLMEIGKTMDECQKHITKLEKEITQIEYEIEDLQQQLSEGIDLRPETIKECHELIKRFEKQLALRQTKITFYETCKQKLQSLYNNHLLALKLEAKQKKLQDLQKDQYQELATMESLKADLEREDTYLKTIDRLSLRMLNSQSLQEAEALKNELILVTKELKNL